MVSASIELSQRAATLFTRSGVNKSHYESNLRHLVWVYKGLLLAEPRLFVDPSSFLSLWVHPPLSRECGTYKTVQARFWSWLSGKSF